jgi:hypothetical protein
VKDQCRFRVQAALPESIFSEKISPAKAQSAAAFLKGFLCAFAREIFSVEHTVRAKRVQEFKL